MEEQDIFVSSPWVQLDSRVVEALTEGIAPSIYRSKASIMNQGQSRGMVYIVKSGRVLIYITSPNGQDKTLMIAEQGCMFGETGAIFDIPNSISARAKTDAVLYCLTANLFRERVMADAQLAWRIIELYARKLRLMSCQVAMLTFDPPEIRVRKILFWLSEVHGEKTEHGIVLKRKLTQQNIADITGLSRVSVANVFAQLYSRGILTKEDRYLCITDIEALSSFI